MHCSTAIRTSASCLQHKIVTVSIELKEKSCKSCLVTFVTLYFNLGTGCILLFWWISLSTQEQDTICKAWLKKMCNIPLVSFAFTNIFSCLFPSLLFAFFIHSSSYPAEKQLTKNASDQLIFFGLSPNIVKCFTDCFVLWLVFIRNYYRSFLHYKLK